jgi:hypothetical protein
MITSMEHDTSLLPTAVPVSYRSTTMLLPLRWYYHLHLLPRLKLIFSALQPRPLGTKDRTASLSSTISSTEDWTAAGPNQTAEALSKLWGKSHQ